MFVYDWALQSKFSCLFTLRASTVVIRALLKLKIRAKNAVLDPVYSRKIDLRREEMFRCLSCLISFPQGWVDNFNGPNGVFVAVSMHLFIVVVPTDSIQSMYGVFDAVGEISTFKPQGP